MNKEALIMLQYKVKDKVFTHPWQELLTNGGGEKFECLYLEMEDFGNDQGEITIRNDSGELIYIVFDKIGPVKIDYDKDEISFDLYQNTTVYANGNDFHNIVNISILLNSTLHISFFKAE